MSGTSSLSQLLTDYTKRQVPSPAEELHWAGLVRRWLDHPGGHDNAPLNVRRAGERARNRLVEGNIRWVITVARKQCHGRYSEERMMEAIQLGIFGLIRAVERFDPTRGYKLSTFSYYWILQTIQRGEERSMTIRVPESVVRECRKLEQAAFQLNAQGIRPTRDRLAEEAGVPAVVVEARLRTIQLLNVSSLDATIADAEGTTGVELIAAASDDTVERNFDLEAMQDWLAANLDALTDRQREAFMRLRQGHSRKDVARAMGISISGVGSHHAHAVEALRRRLDRQQQQMAA
jgi:RNA polymerase sigma factor (sigma-70 family)